MKWAQTTWLNKTARYEFTMIQILLAVSLYNSIICSYDYTQDLIQIIQTQDGSSCVETHLETHIKLWQVLICMWRKDDTANCIELQQYTNPYMKNDYAQCNRRSRIYHC